MGLRLASDVAEWIKAKARSEERSPAFIVARLVRQEMAREARAKKPKAAKR